jgi:hypothetical protein
MSVIDISYPHLWPSYLVYQQDAIDNILEFAYRISKALPGQ